MLSIIWKKKLSLTLIWVNYLLLFIVKSDQFNPFSSYWRYFYFLCKVPKKRVCRKRFKMEIAAWNCGTAWQIFFCFFFPCSIFLQLSICGSGFNLSAESSWAPASMVTIAFFLFTSAKIKIKINDLTSNRCNAMQFIITFYEKTRLWPDLESTIIQVCMCFSYHKIRP